MDYGQFDDLTRSVASGGGTRRAVVRLLAGGALTGLAARFVMGDVTLAKAKEPQGKRQHERGSQPERTAHGQIQAEGKHKNHRHKKPKDPPPSPVCDNGLPRCPDGSCGVLGECCPGSRRCNDGFCYKEDQCCPGEGKCPGGACVPFEECCPDAIPPLCNACEEEVCVNGELVCRPIPGGVVCPGVRNPGYGLPPGCCAAGRVFPDEWYGTGNLYCRPERDPGSYWCTIDGLPGT